MEYSILVIMLALLQYLYFSFRTGFSRPKYDVHPPKTVGNETWERIFRIQQNTMEQLIVFIPGMIGFSQYVSSIWAAILGICFIVFRQIYSISYLKEPKKRIFPPTFLVNVALVIGTAVGIILHLVRP